MAATTADVAVSPTQAAAVRIAHQRRALTTIAATSTTTDVAFDMAPSERSAAPLVPVGRRIGVTLWRAGYTHPGVVRAPEEPVSRGQAPRRGKKLRPPDAPVMRSPLGSVCRRPRPCRILEMCNDGREWRAFSRLCVLIFLC
jgi:hypothetical protein